MVENVGQFHPMLPSMKENVNPMVKLNHLTLLIITDHFSHIKWQII